MYVWSRHEIETCFLSQLPRQPLLLVHMSLRINIVCLAHEYRRAEADGIIDFSTPATSLEMAALAAQARIVHVIGTTGFSDADLAKLTAASRHATIVKSGNMSLGVNLVAGLARKAAAALGAAFDVEIVEMHHRMKVDAPSGTALLLGEAVARGHGVALAEKAVRGRDGVTGARKAGAIGFAALRGGTVVGEHSVILAGEQERLVLSHVAEDRAIFARGAVRAARAAPRPASRRPRAGSRSAPSAGPPGRPAGPTADPRGTRTAARWCTRTARRGPAGPRSALEVQRAERLGPAAPRRR